MTHENQVKKKRKKLQSPNLRSLSIAVPSVRLVLKFVRDPTISPFPFVSKSSSFSISSLFLEFGHVTMKISMRSPTLLNFTSNFLARFPEERQQDNHRSPRHMELSETLPGFETSAYHHDGDSCNSGKGPKARTTLFLYVNSGYLEGW